jgi:hypothetical protein
MSAESIHSKINYLSSRNNSQKSPLENISILRYEKNDFETYRKKSGYLRSENELSSSGKNLDIKYTQYRKNIANRFKKNEAYKSQPVEKPSSSSTSFLARHNGVPIASPNKQSKPWLFKKAFKLRLLIVLVIAVIGILISSLGIILHTLFGVFGGIVWQRNQYIPTWLCVCLLFYSLQAIYSIFKDKANFLAKYWFHVDGFVFGLTVVFATLISVSYCLIRRYDAFFWATCIAFINMLNLFTVFSRRSQSLNSIVPGGKSSTYMEVKTNKDGCFCAFFSYLNVLLKIAFFIVLGLLVVGAIIIGFFSLKYDFCIILNS